MASITRVVRNEAEIARLKRALAFGMLNLGMFIEGQAKQKVPVRTGNLRRSIHTVAFQDGQVIGGDGPAPDYGPDLSGIGCIVGTNVGYGRFVELGTVRMAARPFLAPAFQEGMAKAQQLVIAGARKHYGG